MKPIELKYSLCHPAGCTAETEATPEILAEMAKGGGIMVLAMNAAAQPVGFPVPLDGYNEATAGPPVDNKKYAEARSSLMKQIRERQQKMAEQWKEKELKNLPLDAPGAPPTTTGSTKARRPLPRRNDTFGFGRNDLTAPVHAGAAFPCAASYVAFEMLSSFDDTRTQTIIAVAVVDEPVRNIGMPERLRCFVVQQVLLGDVGDVRRLGVLSVEMIVGLIFPRPHILGDRQPPLLRVRELGVDIEDQAAKRIEAMANHLTDRELGMSDGAHVVNV